MIGAVGSFVRATVVNGFVRQRLRPVPTEQNQEDLLALTALIEDGKPTSVVDRTSPLADTAEVGSATWSRATRGARWS